MTSLLISAMAWCDGFTLPLVVPLNGWLQPPLPAQSFTLNAPGIRIIEFLSVPLGLNAICIFEHEPEIWHVPSNQSIYTFKGRACFF